MRAIDAHPSLDLIHAFEGNEGQHEPTRTQDPVGNYEIGWSHKLSGPSDPLWDATLTEEDADALALKDLADFAHVLSTGIDTAEGHIPGISDEVIEGLSTGQWAAIVDFTYNVGPLKALTSTLIRYVEVGNHAGVPGEFPKWVYATKPDGTKVVLQGLVNRRQAERQVWLESPVAAPLIPG